MKYDPDELIWNWNKTERSSELTSLDIEINDETLRDGLQSPSSSDPATEDKIALLRLADQLEIDGINLGYPGASRKMYEDVLKLSKTIDEENLSIKPNCAARTIARDIDPIVEITEKTGVPIEASIFIASSPIRIHIQNWSIQKLVKMTRDSIRLSKNNNLPTMFITEDTTRARPEDLEKLYLTALEEGVDAICIADTVGYATPAGTKNLVSFITKLAKDHGYSDVRLDWHGHRDRGLALANALAAIEAGIDRIHATGLGLGERSGNTPLDLLLVNLKLMGFNRYANRDLTKLTEYTDLIATFMDLPIPPNYPVIGKDAFRTASGVHASAIKKAKQFGIEWMDNVYSSINATEYGKSQKIELGSMSGMSNIEYKLREMGVTATIDQKRSLLKYVKSLGRLISDEEIIAFIRK